MVHEIDIDSITPAKYNPRRISDSQFEALKESLCRIGCVVPVIINKQNNVIIAGHQRTRAMKACGMKKTYVVYVDEISEGDEITFNQLHNGTEYIVDTDNFLDQTDIPKECFTEVPASRFSMKKMRPTAIIDICRILMKYGNVLSAVSCRGRIFLGCGYIVACQRLRMPVNVYVCDDGKFDDLKKYFTQNYGEYCYDHLEKHTYVQGLAQMFRSVEKNGNKRQNKSRTYCEMVLPYLKQHGKSLSILDFGCGKGAYINYLKENGYDAVGVEFYNNNGVSIDVGKGNRQIDELIKHIKTKGQFDVVVCDSVLNSVDSMDAENAVLGCLNAFCKPDGVVFVSGITLDRWLVMQNLKHQSTLTRCESRFFDSNGFSAKYRKGSWYYQHFHTKEALAKSLTRAKLKCEEMYFEQTFCVRCSKIQALTKEELRKCIDFEFSLPLPGNRSYQRSDEVYNCLI